MSTSFSMSVTADAGKRLSGPVAPKKSQNILLLNANVLVGKKKKYIDLIFESKAHQAIIGKDQLLHQTLTCFSSCSALMKNQQHTFFCTLKKISTLV